MNPDGLPRTGRRLERPYLALWIVLGMVHLTQAVWVSGWKQVPGDAGDGRFNNLVLEHGYQSLLGRYPWATPGQFHPVEGTLAYSDTLWGTLPFYIPARFLGLSPFSAFQVWACLIGLANILAVLHLLKTCRVPWVLGGPLCFLAASPAVLVWFAGGHIQLLALFPLPMALARIIRFRESGEGVHLAWAIGWLGWLNLNSPYLGFFGALAAVPFIAMTWRLVPRLAKPEADKVARKDGRPHPWAVPLLFAALTLVPTAVMYALYLSGSGETGTRPWSELVDLAPGWRSWLNPPPGHLFRFEQLPAWSPANLSEQALFSGWIPWIASALALITWIRNRACPEARLAGLFALVALSLALFFFRFTDSGAGFYLELARHIDWLRAFRASGRVALVVHLFQAMALAMLLSLAWNRSASRLARVVITGLAVLAALEVLTLYQVGTPKSWLEARRDALINEWNAAGGRPILLFAPGASNQPSATVHLDAWSAALGTGRKTINGYSGNRPASHGRFLADPTLRKGETVAAFHRLPSNRISVVTSWGPDEATLGIERYPTQPVKHLEGFELDPVRWELSFPVESFVIDGIPVHQVTPMATVVFELPAGARSVSFLLGLRKGAYSESGNSDGVGVTWTITDGNDRETLYSAHWNPRDREDHRGLVRQSFAVPEGGGELTLVVDYGPAGNGAWDWPVFGDLKVE